MNPKVDEYIDKAQPFARPILNHLRQLIHKVCPEVTENIKWGMPFFEYKGPLCNIAAFKQHAVFGFWKDKLLKDVENIKGQEEAMGSLGKITKLEDLPSDAVLKELIKQAMELNEKGIKIASAGRKADHHLEVPDFFLKALKTNKKAQENFAGFSFSHKREYLEWITGAKTEETRSKRIATALEWIANGKPKEWQYIKK